MITTNTNTDTDVKTKYTTNISKFIHTKSIEIFKQIMKYHNLKFYQSSPQQDIKQHIDYFIIYKNNKIPINVKSNQELLNIGKTPEDTEKYTKMNENDKSICLEFTNVQGNTGWINGNSKYLCYVFPNKLMLVSRENLKNMADLFVFHLPVNSYDKAFYKHYKRHNRNDLISRVHLKMIKKYCKFITIPINSPITTTNNILSNPTEL